MASALDFSVVPSGVDDLILDASTPEDWLIEDLLQRGDQVVVAAQPKLGKSLLCTQIQIALASGSSFLMWEVKKRVKTLYINLEINAKQIAIRLIKQAGGEDEFQEIKETLFVENEFKSLDINSEDHFNGLVEYIGRISPDVVVWDVLSRIHSCDENDNLRMAKTMLLIRQASGTAASIVVHHTRKPPAGMEEKNQGAFGIRGASSIHGEADLVMVLSKKGGIKGGGYSLSFSARNIEEPEEMTLKLSKDLIFYSYEEDKQNELKKAVLEAFGEYKVLSSINLNDFMRNYFNVKNRSASSYMKSALNYGFISHERMKDKTHQYTVLI